MRLFSVRYICEDFAEDDINLTAGLKEIINPPLHYSRWLHTSFQQHVAQTRVSPEHAGLGKSTEAELKGGKKIKGRKHLKVSIFLICHFKMYLFLKNTLVLCKKKHIFIQAVYYNLHIRLEIQCYLGIVHIMTMT